MQESLQHVAATCRNAVGLFSVVVVHRHCDTAVHTAAIVLDRPNYDTSPASYYF
jgi:hypothetical protein